MSLVMAQQQSPLHQRRGGGMPNAGGDAAGASSTTSDLDRDDDTSLVDSLLQDNPLQVWALRNSVLQPKCSPTFVDSSGFRRYVRDWEVVKDRISTPLGSSRAHGGMFEIPIDGTNRRILLIDDYLMLWNSIALHSESDSFGRHAILFELAALLLYDEKTMNFVYGLMLYNCFLDVVLGVLSQWYFVEHGWDTALAAMGMEVLMCHTYLACARVYKASYSGNMLTANPVVSEISWRQVYTPEVAAQLSLQLYSSAGLFPIKGLLCTHMRVFWLELLTLCGLREGYAPEGAPAADDLQRMVDSSLSVEMGVMGRAQGDLQGDVEQAQPSGGGGLGARQDAAAQCGYYMLLNVGSKFLESHTAYRMQDNNVARCTLIFSFLFVVVSLFIIWLLRMAGSDCILGHTMWAGSATTSCVTTRVYFVMSLGALTVNWSYLFYYMGIIVGITGIMYGASIVQNLATLWVARYASLRKLAAEDGSDEVLAINGTTRVSRALLLRRIRTDAYEHYMFIQHYTRQCSELWSGLLLFIIVVSLILFALCLFTVTGSMVAGQPAVAISMTISAVIFLALALMPIYSLGVANSAMGTLKQAFISGATPSNYEVIGGRDEWIEFIAQSPAYWTIFGFAVTWSVLYVYLSSAFGSSLIVLLTTISREIV